MVKEEFKRLKSTVKQWLFHTGSLDPTKYANELKLKFIEPRENWIGKLEQERQGLKDYCNDYVKTILSLRKNVTDLEKKNEELEMTVGTLRTFSNEQSTSIEELKQENEKLDKQIDTMLEDCKRCAYRKTSEQLEQLTKAKEIIKNLLILKNDHFGNTKMEWRVEVTEQAEQFLKEIEK